MTRTTLDVDDTMPDRPTTDPRPAHPGWFVVTQVKANRVVYFTNDPAYQPPMEGDWYFVTHFLGELPAQMSLANCWGWRFNGGVFTDAREPDEKQVQQTLLESNRRALVSLLRDKINRARAHLAPSCSLGDAVRSAKLREAHRYRALAKNAEYDSEDFELLRSVAAARNIPLAEAAQMLIAREQDMWRELVATEGLRERFATAIRDAGTQDDLIRLRSELLEEIVPEQSRHFAYPSNPMKPEDWQAPLPEVHRAHEMARLRTQLRQIVNTKRARVHCGYIEDEALIRHKAKLAQTLLNNEGQKPPGADFSLLEAFADAQSLSLVNAARLILGTVNEGETILRSTEILKDRLMAEIERISNRRDIQRIEQELERAVAHRSKE